MWAFRANEQLLSMIQLLQRPIGNKSRAQTCSLDFLCGSSKRVACWLYEPRVYVVACKVRPITVAQQGSSHATITLDPEVASDERLLRTQNYVLHVTIKLFSTVELSKSLLDCGTSMLSPIFKTSAQSWNIARNYLRPLSYAHSALLPGC